MPKPKKARAPKKTEVEPVEGEEAFASPAEEPEAPVKPKRVSKKKVDAEAAKEDEAPEAPTKAKKAIVSKAAPEGDKPAPQKRCVPLVMRIVIDG